MVAKDQYAKRSRKNVAANLVVERYVVHDTAKQNVVNVVELYVLVGFARRSLAMYKRMEGALN